MVFLLKDLFYDLVSSKGCKLQRRDPRLLSVRSSILIFSLLILHHHHHRETMLDKTNSTRTMFQLWAEWRFCQQMSTEAAKPECSSRCQSNSQAQHQHDYSSKAEPSSCSYESCGNRRCSNSSRRYQWYDPYQ
jgi:hypothetical protein